MQATQHYPSKTPVSQDSISQALLPQLGADQKGIMEGQGEAEPTVEDNTQASYSFELFKFHDFLQDLFTFSRTLGLAVTLTFLFLAYFWTLNSSTDTTLVSTTPIAVCAG